MRIGNSLFSISSNENLRRLEENDLEEAGIGPRIPAEPLELKSNMHGPAPRPIHAHAMKFHATLWGRDGGLSQDLGKRSQNARTKAHEWGGGTCRSLQNAHRFTMRACLRTRFFGWRNRICGGRTPALQEPAGWVAVVSRWGSEGPPTVRGSLCTRINGYCD